jgi:hypothetical protein
MTVDVKAFGPVLQELRYVDRELYRATETALKQAADPLVKDVRAAFPTKILTGMMTEAKSSKRRRGPYPVYKIGKVRQQVNSRVGGRKRTGSDTWPVLRITQRNGAAMIFDMAQNTQTRGNTLSENLKTGYGNASRVMWPTVRKNIHKVERAIRREMDKAERLVVSRTGGISQYQAASARASSQTRNRFGRFGV